MVNGWTSDRVSPFGPTFQLGQKISQRAWTSKNDDRKSGDFVALNSCRWGIPPQKKSQRFPGGHRQHHHGTGSFDHASGKSKCGTCSAGGVHAIGSCIMERSCIVVLWCFMLLDGAIAFRSTVVQFFASCCLPSFYTWLRYPMYRCFEPQIYKLDLNLRYSQLQI